ncbi:hypothetical protein M513_09284 [Trichuris suis]|uniref:Uncharacterized protein n=1 Tax=Trichuris suis TaxID=68888 RepID=A0A085LXX1_9BILA|nr:hypothetical protein M513_09284 [Trichuris suis]
MFTVFIVRCFYFFGAFGFLLEPSSAKFEKFLKYLRCRGRFGWCGVEPTSKQVRTCCDDPVRVLGCLRVEIVHKTKRKTDEFIALPIGSEFARRGCN